MQPLAISRTSGHLLYYLLPMAEQRVKMGKAKLGKFTGALCGAAQRAAADGRVVAQRVAADGRVVAQRAAADGYGAAQRATADGKKYLNGVAKARQDRQAAGGTEGKEAADGLPEKEKQLKGHAIQERELSPGDHVRHAGVSPGQNGAMSLFPLSRVGFVFPLLRTSLCWCGAVFLVVSPFVLYLMDATIHLAQYARSGAVWCPTMTRHLHPCKAKIGGDFEFFFVLRFDGVSSLADCFVHV